MKARQDLKNTLSALAQGLGVTKKDLLSHCRKVELVDARSMIVAVLMEHAHLRQQDVAPLLDITQSAVSWLLIRHRLMMKHPGGNPDYQKRFAEFVMKALTPLPPSPKREGDAKRRKDSASGRHPSPPWRGAGGEVKKN